MPSLAQLPLGFAQPVDDAQAAFRAALQALSRPGLAVDCGVDAPTVEALMPASVALLLALTDHETPVWWGAACRDCAAWLRFHTGAPSADQPKAAAFAVCTAADEMPPLRSFGAGTDLAPEGSATLIVELASWSGGPTRRWSGPGLKEALNLQLPVPTNRFWTDWADNHARFPSGVDVIFVCGRQLIGLPRTTAVAVVPTSVPTMVPAITELR